MPPPACLALPPNAAKWLYLAGFVAQALAMWALRAYGQAVLRYVGPLAECMRGSPPAAAVAACIGKGAVLRLAWGGVLFFGAHALLTAGVTRADNPRRLFHSGCPPLQILVWAGLCASAFAIPNHVFVGFGQVSGREDPRRGRGKWVRTRRLSLLSSIPPQQKKTPSQSSPFFSGRPRPGRHLPGLPDHHPHRLHLRHQ